MSRQTALLRKRRDLGGFHILELRLATKEQTCVTPMSFAVELLGSVVVSFALINDSFKIVERL